MLYVAAINGRSDIRLGFLVMNSLGRPQNQTVKAPEKVPNIKQVHLESGTYKSGHISQEMRCVQCNNVACEPDSIFCSAACSQASRIGAPKLLLVPPHHVMHQFGECNVL